MVSRNDALITEKNSMFRLLRNTVIGLIIFLALDRGLDAVLIYGVDRYFGLNTPEALVLVGHSHVVLGIDRVQLEREVGVPVSKYARAGAQLEDRILMAKHYASRNSKGPRAIVFGVDGHLFSSRGLSSSSHLLFYPHVEDSLIAAHVRAHSKHLSEYVLRRFVHLARYNDVLINAARRGLIGDWSSGVGGRFDPDRLALEAAQGQIRPIGIEASQIEKFEAFLEEAKANDWTVILTFVPTTAAWNALDPARFAQVLELLQSYGKHYTNVTFLDMRDRWSDKDELFADPIHLNANGQRKVTGDLAQRLAAILP